MISRQARNDNVNKRGNVLVMRNYVALLTVQFFLLSAPAYAVTWTIHTGSINYRTSTCYTEAYFNKTIAPLNGEMAWDAKNNYTLNTKIEKVGVISGIEIFDVLQEYNDTQQIKLLAFKASEKLCPFYAWQPIGFPVTNLRSHIKKADTITVVGHNLKFDHPYFEYFTFYKGKPIRLNFVKLAQDEVSFMDDNLSIRYGQIDIEHLKYNITLRNPKDPECCPTGGNYSVYYKFKGGVLKVIKFERTKPTTKNPTVLKQ